MQDVVRTAMPGAKSLDEPAPAPQYGRPGGGASAGDDGDAEYDGDGGAPDEPGVPVSASTGDETMQDAENLYGDEQQPAPAPESTQGDEQPSAAMAELEQDQPLY